MASDEKREGAVAEWSDQTTLHGPSHAHNARNKLELILWICLCVGFLFLALYQSYQLVCQYQASLADPESVTVEVAPNELVSPENKFHLTVCPMRWLDREKVNHTVESGRMSYADLLFALSLMENLDSGVLREMEQWNITNEDRIWGIRKEQCKTPAPATTTAPRKKRDLLGGSGDSLLGDLGNVVDGVVDLTGNLLGGLVGALTGLTPLEKMKAIQAMLCDKPECRTDQMPDWKKRSEDFRLTAQKLNLTDLTEFLAYFAVKQNPLEAFGAKHVRHEIYAGQVCQIVEMSTETLKGGLIKGTAKVGESLEKLLTEAATMGIAGSNVFVALPVSAASDFRSSLVWADLKQRIGSNLAVVSIEQGRQPVYRVNYKEVRHIKRSGNCVPNPSHLVNPEVGLRAAECRAECLAKHTSALDTAGYKLVTGNTMGRVSLVEKLAPGQLLEEDLDKEGLADCLISSHCETQAYCSEWEVVEPEPVTSGIFPPLSACSAEGGLDALLNKFHYSFRFMKATVVYPTPKMSPTDLMGIFGGILGLYLGCSILTVVHFVVHFVKRGIEMVTSRGG